ncbi:MBL fold metallo-hydrolase [Spongiactinospora rosea]|uniref:MBL fold metallo-hydrolase n=1 Tax=Spongiactinospora rosea TaxID=2248750 RepID=A0A366M8L5_9ACTN|nr:MBL fold metallo-hydrolase [Spongiactinospora rosea]RBQ22060.1 MBL fold metallo-hydrolase [Spongiactinospora rosea]
MTREGSVPVPNTPSISEPRLRRPAPIRSLPIGDLTVTYVPDGAVQLKPRAWLPATTDETWAAHPEYLDESGNLVASIGGLLVEHGDRALLIDAGFGPQALPDQPGNAHGAIHGGALLDNLAVIGRKPADIEAVAITHLHIDHVGWAWHPAPGSDAPAFVNAEYLVPEPEWTQRHLYYDAHEAARQILGLLEPRVRTVTDGQEIFPGVTVYATPGHTAGHAAYVIASGGRRLIAFGDALHSSIQIDHPDWSAAPDHDSTQSAAFRRQLVTDLAEPNTIGFGIHFADVQFGHVTPDGPTPTWRPLP